MLQEDIAMFTSASPEESITYIPDSFPRCALSETDDFMFFIYACSNSNMHQIITDPFFTSKVSCQIMM